MILRQMYCPTCKKTYELEFESFDDFVSKRDFQVCEVDSEVLKQDFSSAIIIPSYMKAMGEGSDTYDYAKKVMSKGGRPSGKSKVFY